MYSLIRNLNKYTFSSMKALKKKLKNCFDSYVEMVPKIGFTIFCLPLLDREGHFYNSATVNGSQIHWGQGP